MKKYKNQVEENEEFRLARNQTERQNGERAILAQGVAIAEIERGSIAEELQIAPGSRLIEINGKRARDIIQLKMADLGENSQPHHRGAGRRPHHLRNRKRCRRFARFGPGRRTFRRREALHQ